MNHSGFPSVLKHCLQPKLATFCRYLHMPALLHMSQNELFTFSAKLALPLIVQIPSFLGISFSPSPFPTPHQNGDSTSTTKLPCVSFSQSSIELTGLILNTEWMGSIMSLFLSLSLYFKLLLSTSNAEDSALGFGNTEMNITLLPSMRCQFHEGEVSLCKQWAWP